MAMSQAQQIAAMNLVFQKWAKENPSILLTGSIPAGVSGGTAGSAVTWVQGTAPATDPRLITRQVYFCSIPISVTIPATSGAFTVSQLAPWSMISNRTKVGGANSWDLVECTAFYLDHVTNDQSIDPSYRGLGVSSVGSSAVSGAGLYQDDGGNQFNLGGLAPGATVSNTTGAPVTNDYTLKFMVVVDMKRRIDKLYGQLPNGDPQNQPEFYLQLNDLVGTKPEQCLLIDTGATSGVTAQTLSGGTVFAVFPSEAVNLLPSGLAVPTPTVQLGLRMFRRNVTFTSSGTMSEDRLPEAVLYEKRFNLLLNDKAFVNGDYWALQETQAYDSAVWKFDAQLGNYDAKYELYHRNYKRYLPTGCDIADMVGGRFPQLPSLDPHDQVVTPDAGVAAAFGLKATPSVSTASRIPSSVTFNGGYGVEYDFAFVGVSY